MSDPIDDAEHGEEADASNAATLPGVLVCAGCGAISPGPYCAACGLELGVGTQAEGPDAGWPALGTRLDGGERPIILKLPLPAPLGVRRYLATEEGGGRFEVLVTRRDDESGILARRAEARALLGDAALSPGWATELEGKRHTVTRLPDVPSLSDGLASLLSERRAPDAAEATRRWVLPLTAFLADLHDDGRFFGVLDPAEILVDDDGRCILRDPVLPFGIAEAPVPPTRRHAPRGFSAPEVVGHCTGELGPRADVFFAGAVLYYTLTRIAPLAEAAFGSERLPPPQVYLPDIPPELAAVARRATSPLPARRYADARALHDAIRWALEVHQRRLGARMQRLQLDIGHELHIGVLKGQYAPQNQDDLFLAYEGQTGIGLFVISDGVSISEYGSGDLASACVRQEALDCWRRLSGHAEGLDPHPPRLPDMEGRRRMIHELLDAANRRIAALIHQEMPRFPGPAEGIMAATAIGVVLEGNRALLFSIGDSRIYLIRDGHLISLMVDDDLSTQLLRLGRAPSVARQVPAGGALIRCVGEFEKSEDDRLLPVPLQPGFRELVMLPGDRLMLCSDGIPDYSGLDEEDAEENMRRAVEEAPGAAWAAFELMVLANRGGGGDNISSIVLSFGHPLVPASDEGAA